MWRIIVILVLLIILFFMIRTSIREFLGGKKICSVFTWQREYGTGSGLQDIYSSWFRPKQDHWWATILLLQSRMCRKVSELYVWAGEMK